MNSPTARLPSSPWSSDYADSRIRFIERALVCNASLRSHPINAPGPNNEALSIDVATLNTEGAAHIVVLSSGLHGVEGFLGGAVQNELLHRLASDGLPDGVGIVLIHAANPWGFAHLRRTDENNVDVNRNFIGEALPQTHPGYAALDPLINPQGKASIGDTASFLFACARKMVQARSAKKLVAPIAQGQYTHPQGLFFGGDVPGSSCLALQSILRELIAKHAMITHLDVHSGLGRSGRVTLIGSGNIDTDGPLSAQVEAHYQHTFVADSDPDNAYNAHGTLARWYRDNANNTPYLYLCVEVGTVNPLRVLTALRRENRAHHACKPGSRQQLRAKRLLRDAFAPSSRRWRERSLDAVMDVFERSCQPMIETKR